MPVEHLRSRPIPKSFRSRTLGMARRLAEITTGRSRLYAWLWDLEFDSLIRDADGAE